MNKPFYTDLMRNMLTAALLLICTGCVDPKVPLYQLTAPTIVTPPTPTPTPPPPSTPAALSLIFAVGPSNPIAGNSTAFTANVNPVPTAPVVFTWNFGDGGTRQTAGDTTFYTYGHAGAYIASVSINDAIGRTVSGTAHVNVQNPPAPPPDPPAPAPTPAPSLIVTLTCSPVPHGGVPPTPCNVTATFGPTPIPSASVTNVDWDWGDGGTSPNGGVAAFHPYFYQGTYTVIATVTVASVSSTPVVASKVIVIP